MCMTCDAIQYMKNRIDKDLDYDFYAVINRISYKDGKMNGSIMSGINPLNYCPECGKKLV